jgi:hypothetical protein
VQFLFDAVRAAATDEPEARLDSLVPAPRCVSACEGARKAAAELLDTIEKAEAAHPQTAHELRSVFAEAGIVSVAEALSRPSKGDDVLGLVLERHRDVQQGKFDRGQRKAAWVRRDPANGFVRLTSQRHQLPRSGRYESWDQVPWHPYRTYGARRFVRACGVR